MGFKQVFIQAICSHNDVDISIISENEDNIAISYKCLKCGKHLNKCVIDKISGTVEEIMW